MKTRKGLIHAFSIIAVIPCIWAVAAADSSTPPSADAVAFAQRTSELMTNTVVAALLQEIGETTPDNVNEGNLSIGLIFNDGNRDMRLVGTLNPLSENDLPTGNFEKSALQAAMSGQASTSVERVDGRWYYRRSFPLTNFTPQCAMCHSNFASLPSTAPVGALMLRVPVAN